MRRISKTFGLLTVLTICLFTRLSEAQYGGGTGEPNDPYLIYTADQMNTIGTEPNDWDKHFKLMGDIDLAKYTGEQFNIIGYDRGFKDNKPFRGVFDGNNNSISNFTYSSIRRDCVGIFGYVFGGELRNVKLVDPNVVVTWGDFAGSLAGHVAASKITNCCAEGGSVSSRENVGGLVGRAFLGVMSACWSTTSVSGYLRTGGLIGESRGTVENCYTVGNISGTYTTGGLIGYSYEYDIVTSCWAQSHVYGKSGVGGLVGTAKGILQRCYSGSQVTGTQGCGGLVGSNSGKVFWCYAESTVTGVENVGGLLAGNSGKVFSCYSTCVVTGDMNVGGLIGQSSGGWIQSCFWDTQISGVSTSAGGTPCSTMQMKKANTFRGWHSDGYWTLNEGSDYPRLVWETRAGIPLEADPSGLYIGSGKPNDPYQVRTPDEFVSIAYRREDWGKHFILMCDLDMSTIDSNEIMPIGDEISAFTGTFNGAGHSISNTRCQLEQFNNVGLFGILVAPVTDPNGVIATVKNLHLVNAEIRGGMKVGGLVGWNRGTIMGCSVDGNVAGFLIVGGLVGINHGEINTCSSTGMVSSQQDIAGGLVGQNIPITWKRGGPDLSGNGWANISKSFSSAHVTGEKNIGGLVGIDNGTIANCYSSGSVIGQDEVGGLVGDSRGRTINFCYSTAYVTADVNAGGLIGSRPYYMEDHAFCVWDIDTSNISISAAGRGKTTDEMMSSKTYYCWGVDGNWTLDEGNDYPHLTWENRGGRPISEYDRLYGGGSGDANDPYLISTPQQFITVGWCEEDFNKHFLLMKDLDFNDISSTEIRSIGNAEVPFTGVFNGQNYTISNIKLSLFSRNVGVFGVVGIRIPQGQMRGPKPYYDSGIDAPGFILNLQVSDAHLTGLDMQGILVGFNVNGTVSGCSVTGSVGGGWSGANDVLGGLVGRNMGLIDKCRASCYFKGGYFIGGLVGSNYGTIKSSYSEGEVTGSGFHIGGLAGDNTGHISDCYSQCVTQGGTKVGGLVGSNGGEIINSFCSGNVRGEQQIGGLVGLNYGGATNSYSTGSVSGVEEVGGLVGSNGYIVWSEPHQGRVLYCFSAGSVSGISSAGGFVGYHVAGPVASCFWDMESSSLTNMCGNKGDDATGCDDSLGKTTVEMQTINTFLEAGWDFMNETTNGTEDIWWIDEGMDYPRLWWELIPEN